MEGGKRTRRMTRDATDEQQRFPVRRARGLAWAAFVALLAGGGGGASRSGDTTIRFQLTTAQDVSGLASVRLTAGTTAKTLALQSLSATATVFDLPVPSTLTGSVDVGALARPAAGCMGYSGTGVAYIATARSVATVTILMTPQDICQTTGTAGTSGTAGTTGTAGTGGSISTGTAGAGGSVSTGNAG